MLALDQIVQFLQAHRGRSLVLPTDQPGRFLTEDNVSHLVATRFNEEQLASFWSRPCPMSTTGGMEGGPALPFRLFLHPRHNRHQRRLSRGETVHYIHVSRCGGD